MNYIVLPEIISVGIYNAQLVAKNKSISKNRKTTMFEIELPIGEGGISYIDDETHQINENTVIVAKPGQMRHTRFPFKCYYAHIIIKDGQIRDLLSDLPNFIEIENTDRIRRIFTKMCESYDSGIDEKELLIYSLLLELVYILGQYSPALPINRRVKNNNHEAIERTVEYIKANLTGDLSLQTLSGVAKFTPTYFHKLFKASTGKTLHEYIEDLRIKNAVNMLISTDRTLTQIAYECGFSSQSYFAYAFKRKMGMPPRSYAKMMHERYDTESAEHS